MKTLLKTSFEDFIGLIYPNLCASCDENHPLSGDIFCIYCLQALPVTSFHLHFENELTAKFEGRLSIHTGTALFHFVKQGLVQQLIHGLKYRQKKEIGLRLGKWLGVHLQESLFYKDIGAVVPVPLHPKKEFTRGYNQSDLFAQGIAEILNKPWLKKGLIRKKFTQSQTQKSLTERLHNVGDAFELGPKAHEQLKGCHILLVDDVLTTGATLESCALKLLEIEGVKVSIGVIAIASL